MPRRSALGQLAAESGVLLIVAVLVAGLAGVRLPAAHPGRTPAVYLAMALVTAALFVICAAVHELAHLRAGRTTTANSPASAELVVAAAGPTASLLLGAVCGLVTTALTLSGADGLVISTIAYVGLANLALATATLLPAASLDGGRMLRAWIWRATGDQQRAVRASTRAGLATSFTLILAGVVLLLFTDAVAGLWLALAGWFVAGQLPASSRWS